MISPGVFFIFVIVIFKIFVNIKILNIFIGPLQQFFNKKMFFKIISKCQTEILGCAPPFSHVCDFFCKWFRFCYCVLFGTNVTYLTPQNKFLEDLWYYKLIIFLSPGNHGVGKENYHFKKRCPQKISGCGPAMLLTELEFIKHI